ncbi:unnamed protein product [Lampetra fluviatilis]
MKECGGVRTSSLGTINSPGYPVAYESAQDCRWVISLPRGPIALIFIPPFRLEAEPTFCQFDSLSLWNGGLSSVGRQDSLLAKYCGDNSPGTFIAPEREVTLQLLTDATVTDIGFCLCYVGGGEGERRRRSVEVSSRLHSENHNVYHDHNNNHHYNHYDQTYHHHHYDHYDQTDHHHHHYNHYDQTYHHHNNHYHHHASSHNHHRYDHSPHHHHHRCRYDYDDTHQLSAAEW